MQSSVSTVARKEFSSYFSSPVAFIFLGIFLLVNMFVFFWVEKFFARNISDVRPLFSWMPVLLVFLVAALTMRMWSEERRVGTIEFLLTMPVKTHHLVLGKFVACMMLVAIALLLTVGVPATVSFMGDLDWGPVFGAYLASLLLAGAYVSIGLFISSRSDNQIVSLILTTIVCFAFYLIGTETVGALAGNRLEEFFKLLGTGSRFTSIERGMIDIRDLYYYLSIIGVFLSLNTYYLEKLKWAEGVKNTVHTRFRALTVLLAANFIICNIWLDKTNFLRADLTEGNIYSISDATRSILKNLREPLLIRGYFSSKTHPLLAPLVPRIRDLIAEYQIAGGGRVRSEFIDPREHRELEEEANRRYGIKPLPFQIADKYQASLVNSYFNILIQYGDKYEVLGFQDLIEVKPRPDRTLDVKLRNLEYDITKSIKKVLYGFQNTDDLFLRLKTPAVFHGFISEDAKLPEALKDLRGDLVKILDDFKKQAGGKFEYELKDPQEGDGKLAKEIKEKYGFKPMLTSLFDPNKFYFYMLLKNEKKTVQVPLPEDLSEGPLKKGIESGLKRLAPGFLRTVGLYTPPAPRQNPMLRQFGGMQGPQFRVVNQILGENYTVKNVNFNEGMVPEDVDLLAVIAPKNLTERQLFAIDQFLMKGGTVILATSPRSVSQSPSGVSVQSITSGLKAWLDGFGIEIEDKFVLDPQNENYPVPVRRNLGGFTVQEIKMVDYPLFVDIRGEGLNPESGITSGIPQVTLNWASPIKIDKDKQKDRTVVELLRSSKESWKSDTTTLEPDFRIYNRYGFAVDGERGRNLLGVLVEGKFSSFFAGRESPIVPKKKEEEKKDGSEKEGETKADTVIKKTIVSGVIEKSPDSARLIVFASNDFLADQTLQISASSGTNRYMNSVQLLQNAVDWSLEDRSLLSIRSRGHFTRTLVAMSEGAKMFWEYLNYGLVLAGLALVMLISRYQRTRRLRHYSDMLDSGRAAA